MSDLKNIERLKLETLFEMGGGYVMDFSNKSFDDFVQETVGKDIYGGKYDNDSNSKAKLLRKFWQVESNYTVSILTDSMIELWITQKQTAYSQITPEQNNLIEDCRKITSRLKENTTVEDINSVKAELTETDFNLLAKSIRESIEKNEPETSLDRLHTYMMKFFRKLCEKHSINLEKEETLNALFGKYTKYLANSKLVESKMTEKILKYSINIFDAFNDIRNNKSFAHDNKILNYEESILIFKNITATKKFIDQIEAEFDRKNHLKEKELNIFDDDLPF